MTHTLVLAAVAVVVRAWNVGEERTRDIYRVLPQA